MIRNKYYLYLMEKISRVLHKDPMKYKLERYRQYGAVIGNNVRAFSPISSAESYLIKVGNNVTISSDVKFITHDNSIIKFCSNATDLVGRITVGDNCFIGANSVLLPGIEIGSNCIIAAGSVVAKSFPGGVIVGGNPAKIIGTVSDYVEKHQNEVFDFKGMTHSERKREIFRHTERLIERKCASAPVCEAINNKSQ